MKGRTIQKHAPINPTMKSTAKMVRGKSWRMPTTPFFTLTRSGLTEISVSSIAVVQDRQEWRRV
jgi:hypothetical protein